MKSTGQRKSEINEETYKTNVTKTQKTKRWNPKQLDDMFRKEGKTANEINYARTKKYILAPTRTFRRSSTYIYMYIYIVRGKVKSVLEPIGPSSRSLFQFPRSIKQLQALLLPLTPSIPLGFPYKSSVPIYTSGWCEALWE